MENLVAKHMGYLFQEYGFEIDTIVNFKSFDNTVVTDTCRIWIERDRSHISSSMGPVWSPSGWDKGPRYSLEYLLEYLGLGRPPERPWSPSRQEEQIIALSNLLRPHIRTLCAFFGGPRFEAERDQLERFGYRRQAEELGMEIDDDDYEDIDTVSS